MSRYLLSTILLLVLMTPTLVRALATESLGNAPIGPGWNLDGKLLEIVNVHSRVYWYEVNGNPYYFFKGGPRELNESLRAFAALKHERKEIILLPGPGLWHTFDRKPVPFDWSVHVPMGLHFGGDSEVADNRATFTIHLSIPLAPPLADPAAARGAIANLGSNEFKVREQAIRDLEKLGPSVAPALRQAIKETRATEARDRLEKLLARIERETRLDVLALPEGIPVIGVDDLLSRCRKELSNAAHDVRGIAASALSHSRAPAAEIIPDLERVLKTESHGYPLRCALGVASRMGTAGRPLLPAIRAMKSEDRNVQASCQYAIDAIEKATEVVVPEAEVRSMTTIRKEIREFVNARKKQK